MIRYSLFTDVGDRENNEDNIGMYQKDMEYCFALADGLGGHGRGEVASQLAVEHAVMTFAGGGNTESCLRAAMDNAQKAILERQKEDFSAHSMKTTFVLLYVGDTQIRWAHVGDSRLYHFSQKKLIQRTLDHSVPQMLVSTGQLKEKKIRRHPDRNRLLRVMGTEWEQPLYQLGEVISFQPGQAFLLCTDGFWELIDERLMVWHLRHAKDPEDWISRMVKHIRNQGRKKDMDNYSAIAVWT